MVHRFTLPSAALSPGASRTLGAPFLCAGISLGAATLRRASPLWRCPFGLFLFSMTTGLAPTNSISWHQITLRPPHSRRPSSVAQSSRTLVAHYGTKLSSTYKKPPLLHLPQALRLSSAFRTSLVRRVSTSPPPRP